jgi:hypothetical protein
VAATTEQARVHHALGAGRHIARLGSIIYWGQATYELILTYVGNHELTARALAAIEAGDARELGAVMDLSHKLFTEAGSAICPDELSGICPLVLEYYYMCVV